MKEDKVEVVLEGVMKVIKGGQLIAIVHNDMQKRSQVFYSCSEMGAEQIKNLMENICLPSQSQ